MTLVPLDIPAGFYRNGTDLEQAGRWRDGSLVRWRDNSLRPIGGWRERKTSFATNPIRGLHAWETNNGSVWLSGASHDALIVMTGGGTLYNVTPNDLATGREDAAANVGYGGGSYNYGIYGQPRQVTQNTVPQEATTWALDNWGEYLLGLHYDDGRILEWDLSVPTSGTYFPMDDAAVTTTTSSNPNFTWADSIFPDGQNPASSGIESATASGTFSSTYRRHSNIPIKRGAEYIVKVIFGDNPNVNYQFYVSVNYDNGTTGTYFSSSTYQPSSGVPPTPTVDGSFVADDDGTAVIYFAALTADSIQFNYTFYSLDINSDGNVSYARPLPNAPINNVGMVVTEERFVFALGAGGNPRRVQWCDRENNTLWTPAATNEAGDIDLQTSGQIMQGIRTRGQTLIITDTDAHTARYLGPPYVYGFERVGTSCGAVSRKSASDVDIGVFWMGKSGFFRFDGNSVQEIPCDVHDYVFGDINVGQISKVWSFANGQNGEIWWFYPSSGSTEIDRYVAFDYKENHWLIGEMSRTAGLQGGVFQYPIMAGHNTDSDLYDHEVGYNFDNETTFAESGPISLGAGDNIAKVTKLIPDEITQGDVNVTFKTRFYPNATETTHGPYTPANPTSVRFSGRQLRMRVEGQSATQWKVGNMRIDTIAGGKR